MKFVTVFMVLTAAFGQPPASQITPPRLLQQFPVTRTAPNDPGYVAPGFEPDCVDSKIVFYIQPGTGDFGVNYNDVHQLAEETCWERIDEMKKAGLITLPNNREVVEFLWHNERTGWKGGTDPKKPGQPGQHRVVFTGAARIVCAVCRDCTNPPPPVVSPTVE